MLIKNIRIGGKICNIKINGDKIEKILPADSSEKGFEGFGLNAIPGLIDVHLHGYKGYDTMNGDFKDLCRELAYAGTTSFLPTTMTEDLEKIKNVTLQNTEHSGAQILGFHLEGPFISNKYKGAQDEKYILPPKKEYLNGFKKVKMITLAPETDGAKEFIENSDAIISLGHTAADFDVCQRAFESGAKCLTHMFNAMPAMLHRAPGPIGAAIENDAYVQIICDGIHVAEPVIKAAYRIFGKKRTVLISDSIPPAGLPDGKYLSGGLDVFVNKKRITLQDGTLAGSYSCLMDCVKKAVEFGIPPQDAIDMASKTPAELLGINKGQIKEGYDADILLTDSMLNIKAVIIAGEIFS